MILINTIDDRYFELDGIQFARIYQPLAQGSEAIGIYLVYDTKLQLVNSTAFGEFRVDGIGFATQEETIVALLAVIYSTLTVADFDELQTEVDALDVRVDNLEENQVTGVEVYSTLADLPATGTLLVSYKVSNDSTSTNNGFYHWSGSAYIKDADIMLDNAILANDLDASGNQINDLGLGVVEEDAANILNVRLENHRILEDDADCNVGSGFTIKQFQDFVVDLTLLGVYDPLYGYSIGIVKRNSGSPLWQIALYKRLIASPNTIVTLCGFSASVSPEDGDNITIHDLNETASSGVSGVIAVRWSAVPEAYYSDMWKHKGYGISSDVFDVQSAYKRNSIESKEYIDDTLKGNIIIAEEDGGVKSIYINEDSWKHPRGDSEYDAPSAYGGATIQVMFYDEILNDVSFNALKVQLWNTVLGTSTEVRIYKNETGVSINNASSPDLTLLKTFIINDLDTVKSFYTFEFEEYFKVLAGTIIQVFTEGTGNGCTIARWTTFFGASPERHKLYLTTSSTPFVSNWSVGSEPTYMSAPIWLTNTNSELESKQEKPVKNIVISKEVFIAVGRELNIFYDELGFTLPRTAIAAYGASCAVGLSKERSFRYTPTSARSDALIVTAYDWNGDAIESKTVTIESVLKTAGSGTKQMLFFGDSLMSGGGIPREVYDLTIADGGFTPVLLGTVGSTPYFHEGRGGFRWQDAALGTASNPFWIGGKLDFQQYMTDNGFVGNIDIMFIQLAINDIWGGASTNEVVGYMKTVIDALLSASEGFPACKVLIGLSPLGASSLDAYANNYGAGLGWLNYQKNMREYLLEVLRVFDEAVYDANVSVVPSHLFVDRQNGYPTDTEAISSRVSTLVTIQANYLHPTTSGYEQISDAVYSHIRGLY